MSVWGREYPGERVSLCFGFGSLECLVCPGCLGLISGLLCVVDMRLQHTHDSSCRLTECGHSCRLVLIKCTQVRERID